MASKKLFYTRPNYVYPYPETELVEPDQNLFEFDEYDVYHSNDQMPSSFENSIPIPISRSSKKTTKITVDSLSGHRKNRSFTGSLPVNVPDWSKILKNENRLKRDDSGSVDGDGNGNDEDSDGGHRIPPHEYLARRRGASLSVHEGIGRTLKGRDLRRVRNAIWEKTGFED